MKSIYKLTTAAMMTLSLFAVAKADFTQADLEKMVKELETHATKFPEYTYPIQCEIVEDDEVNAYATVFENKDKKMQAKMVVFTGLVKYYKEDHNLIRAVVAHEVSHLSHGHCTSPIWKAQDLGQFWTRQQEMEADVSGAALLVRAGYKKEHMVEMLKGLAGVSKPGNWIYKVTSDHASPMQRASLVSDSPTVLEALVQHDVASAYWDARSFAKASEMFDRAYSLEPKLFTAAVNAAATSLMDYYDQLPAAVQQQWYRPDFGPLLAPNPINSGRSTSITEDDRVRFRKAVTKIEMAKLVAADQPKLKEIEALAGLLNPDNDKAAIQSGVDIYKSLLPTIAANDVNRTLRFNNNIAVGLQRLDKTTEALEIMSGAISGTGKINYIMGENFSRDARVDKEGGLAANIMAYWLKTASRRSPKFTDIQKRYSEFCSKLNIKPEVVSGRIDEYEPILSLNIEGTEIGLYDEFADLALIAGKPDKAVFFDPKYKSLLEVIWKGGDIQAFVEKESILRITSRLPGSYITLRPVDRTVTTKPIIKVGMTAEAFKSILDPNQGVTVKLSKLGSPEEWTYFPKYFLGVKIEDGKVTGITFTPVAR